MPKTPPYSQELKRGLGARRSRCAKGKTEGLASGARDGLRRLRREVKVLAEERETLKRAAAFFASESKTR